MPDERGHFTYAEWEKWAIDKIADIATGRMKLTEENYREHYLRVQVEAMIRQAVRHGRSGLGNDDPVSP